MSLAGAHQILASRFAFDSARQVLKGEDISGIGPLSWLTHGTYSLKGVDEPIEICEVGEEGEAALSPPGDSEKARRHVAPGDEPVTPYYVPVYSSKEGVLTCRYVRGVIDRGAATLGNELSAFEKEALACFESLAQRDEVRFEVMLQPGEASFINNYEMLHARTGFVDWDEARRVLGGTAGAGDDMGTFWHAPRCNGLLSHWFPRYDEAQASLAVAADRMLLPYRRQFVVVGEPYLLVEGTLQIQEGVTSIKADRVIGLTGGGPDPQSHDFR